MPKQDVSFHTVLIVFGTGRGATLPTYPFNCSIFPTLNQAKNA